MKAIHWSLQKIYRNLRNAMKSWTVPKNKFTEREKCTTTFSAINIKTYNYWKRKISPLSIYLLYHFLPIWLLNIMLASLNQKGSSGLCSVSKLGILVIVKQICKTTDSFTLVDRTCFSDDSNWRSICSSSLLFRGPKSSPRRFLDHQGKGISWIKISQT